jgi:hypothetical protein
MGWLGEGYMCNVVTGVHPSKSPLGAAEPEMRVTFYSATRDVRVLNVKSVCRCGPRLGGSRAHRCALARASRRAG